MAATTVVLVTGAAGNLGAAVAEAFAADGACLVLVDLDEDRLAARYPNLGAQGLLAPCDLLDAAALAGTVAAAVERFGAIDVLCNIAGGFAMGPAVHETTPAEWARMMDLNAGTVLATARAVVPGMIARRSGRIVNIGATAGLAGAAGMAAYAAAKGAVIRLTEAMAAELGPQGIMVNAILPSIIDTPENRAAMPGADPAGWVAPATIARLVAFLGSAAAGRLNGNLFPLRT